MCIGLKYSANTRRLPVLARTHSAQKNLPSITTSELCILCVFQYYCIFVFQFAEDVSFADFLIATKDQEKVIFVIVQF